MSLPAHELLHGVLPVLQTPLNDRGDLDLAILNREIDWAFATGADGVVTGMVSETLRLGFERRKQLASAVCQGARGRGSIVISVGADSTADAVHFAQHAAAAGATCLMAIPSTATPLRGAALTDYFAAIASSTPLPLVVQDASSYVGAPIDLSVYLTLLERFGPERIFFKPECPPLGPNLSRLRDATQGRARIFEGSGGINLVDCFRRGIAGTMPGTDLLDAVVALWRALKAGDERRIYQLSLPLGAIVALQLQAGLDGFLAIEKYLLCQRGVFSNAFQVEPVNWRLDPETRAEVDRLFELLRSAL